MKQEVFAPEKDGLMTGRKVELFHHKSLKEWGGPEQLDSFMVLHPKKKPTGKIPLYVVMHSAGHDLFSCLGTIFAKGNHDIYHTPEEMFGLYPDCRAHQEEDFWWGGINAKGDGDPKRSKAVQPVEKRIIETVLWTVRNYPIDPDRVYIVGNSMGGSGALGIGLARGDIFAAIKVNVPAGVRHAADRCYLDRKAPKGFALPDPPPVIDYSAQNDGWSAGHEILYKGMAERRYALYGFWAPFGHANNDEVMLKKNDLIHSIGLFAFRRDQAYPVFTGASTDDPIPWPDHLRSRKAGQVNGFFRWKLIADKPGEFRMKIFLASPETLQTAFPIPQQSTADVSVRRLQKFKVKPGETVRWQYGECVGVVKADKNGLVTVPQLTVTAAENELLLRK